MYIYYNIYILEEFRAILVLIVNYDNQNTNNPQWQQ